MATLKDDTIKATGWNFLKVMVGQVRSFIVSIVLARLLMPEDFGVIGMAMVFAGLADSFIDFGFGNAIIQKKEVTQEQKSTVFYINMLMGVLLTIIMYLLADAISLYFEMPILRDIVKLMSLAFLVKGFSALQSALFKKGLNYKTPFKIEVISGVLSAALGIYLAVIGYNVWSLVYSQMFGWLVSTLLLWCFSTWKPSLKFSLKSVKELWRFGYKFSLSIFIDQLFNRLDTIIIGKLFTAATLGLFYKSKALIRLAAQYAFGSFGSVLYPVFSKINDNPKQVKEVFIKVLHVTCFTTFLFSGLLVINAEEIIVILYSEKWIESAQIFEFLGLFTFVYTIPSVLNSPLLAIGKSGPILKLEIWKKCIYLLSIPAAIFSGFYGYLLATVLASVLGMLLNFSLVNKYLFFSITNQLKVIQTYAVPYIILVLFAFWFNPYLPLNNYYALIIKGSLYLLGYLSVNYFFKNVGCMKIIEILLIKLKIK